MRDEITDYYCYEPPSVLENLNIFERYFELEGYLSSITENLEKLQEVKDKYEEKKVGYSKFREKAEVKVRICINNLELIDDFYGLILREDEFHDFWQSLAGAYWRFEENRFYEEDRARSLLHHLDQILKHAKGSKPTIEKIWDFFIRRYDNIAFADVHPEFEDDLFEARDHACAKYYSTALFVLGRAIEKALHIIGEKREIIKIKIKFEKNQIKNKKWKNATFSQMNEALHEAESVMNDGKVLNQKQYSEVKKLVSYRNDAAHKDYENLEEKRADREMRNGVALLEDLSSIITELERYEGEINELEQTISPP